MLETWIQWTCDGCGKTEYHVESNVPRATVLALLRADGWRRYKGCLDYCPRCVENGAAARRETDMDS